MKVELKIKICGMREGKNIADIATLGPDYMGFIFCPSSKRSVGEDFRTPTLPNGISAVGVFVDESLENVLNCALTHGFTLVQLHGREDAEYCRRLKEKRSDLKIIKALPVESSHALPDSQGYESACDYFLFDTKLDSFGGSGKTFEWEILKSYQGKIPFFVAGGLNADNIAELCSLLRSFDLPVHGIDVNSGVESEPALKDVSLVKRVIQTVRA